MGCDGGSIPKRHEIVKTKQKEARDKHADSLTKFQFCALSGMRLKKPIVACRLGHLYNKDAILEHLLDSKSNSGSATQSQISHIRSLKDIKELTIKSRTLSNNDASSSQEKSDTMFVCPISSLEMNGKYRFFFNWTCGCVFSERALKEVPNEKECILCNKSFKPEQDLIILNGEEDEIKELKSRLLNHRRLRKSAKRTSADKDQSSSKSHKSSAGDSNNEPQTNNKRQRVNSVR